MTSMMRSSNSRMESTCSAESSVSYLSDCRELVEFFEMRMLHVRGVVAPKTPTLDV